MATKKTTDETTTTGAAKTIDEDVIARLAGKGEQAINRLAELPGGTKALSMFNDLRARVDDLSKKVRGIDDLERRIAKLEKELATLRRGQKAPAQNAPTRKAAP